MEENKRKQYAHLYEHHEVEDPQPREEKEKPIGPSGQKPPSADGGKRYADASPFLSWPWRLFCYLH